VKSRKTRPACTDYWDRQSTTN